jgi:hypothetical protein
MVGDKQHGPICLAPYLYLDRRAAVPVSIVDEVAHHPLQQGSVAAHDGWFALGQTLLVSNRFLGGDTQQIDIFA